MTGGKADPLEDASSSFHGWQVKEKMCLKFEEGVHFKLEQIHSVPIVDEHFAEVKKM